METKHLTKPTPLILPQVEIKASPVHGYGVFASKNFAVGEMIEEAPALFFESTTRFPIIVYDRVFYAGNDYSCLPLGYGAIYNHADNCNAAYQFERKINLFQVKAIKPIQQGEEIFIDYGDDYFRVRANKALVRLRNNATLRRFLKPLVIIGVLLLCAYISRM